MSEIKRIGAREFRELGLLQELNRLFLHPRGLALEVVIDGDQVEFGGVWDYREDPEGIIFGDSMLDDDESRERAKRVSEMLEDHREAREKLLGSVVQPVPGFDE